MRVTIAAISGTLAVGILAAATMPHTLHTIERAAPASDRRPPSVNSVSLQSTMVGQPCTEKVSIHNPTDGTVRLIGIDLGCACLSASLLPEALAPNERGVLTINFRGAERPGPFAQRVVLHFAQQAQPEWTANVLIKGEATNWARIEPEVIDFGDVSPRESAEVELRVRPLVDGDVTVRPSSPRISADLIGDRIQMDRGAVFRVQLTADAVSTFESGRDELHVLLNGDSRTPIRVPILYRFRRAPFAVIPERVVLTDVRVDTTTVISVGIHPNEATGTLAEPAITHSLGRALECELTRTGSSLTLVMHFHPEGARQFWADTIRLSFGDTSVTIPFVARVIGVRDPAESPASL